MHCEVRDGLRKALELSERELSVETIARAENQLFNTSFYASSQEVAPGFILYMVFKVCI